MDTALARIFLSYFYERKVLVFVCDDDTNIVIGLNFDESIAANIDPLPIPLPTDVEPDLLFGWFKRIVLDWMSDVLWSPSEDIPDYYFQRLFCCYIVSCRRMY